MKKDKAKAKALKEQELNKVYPPDIKPPGVIRNGPAPIDVYLKEIGYDEQ